MCDRIKVNTVLLNCSSIKDKVWEKQRFYRAGEKFTHTYVCVSGLGAVLATSPVCYERLSMADFNWV